MKTIEAVAVEKKMIEQSLNITDLSKKSGISMSRIGKIIKQDTSCNLRTIGRISQALSCLPNEIIKQT